MTRILLPPPHVDFWAPWRLVGNPFRRLDDRERLASLISALPGTGPASLDELIAASARVIQFVGPAGSGKTTHLRCLHTCWNDRVPGAAAFAYLPEGSTRLPPTAQADIWIIDEAQRLATSALRRLLRRTARTTQRLVLSSHVDLSPEIDAAGLSCKTVVLGPADDRRIAAFFDRRLRLAQVPGGAPFQVECTVDAIRAINEHAAGNLERAEHLLYLLFQEVILPGAPRNLAVDDGMIEAVRNRFSPPNGREAILLLPSSPTP